MAQDEGTSATGTLMPTDGTVDTTSNDSLAGTGDSLGVAVDTIGPPMDLDYGYKGFMWGTPLGVIPNLQYMSEPVFIRDSTALQLSGYLGQEDVVIEYVFSDSGFWKAEIDFVLNEYNVENLIGQFRRLEKNISEVYGPPQSTKQKESGPPTSYAIILDQKFSTAFYRSKWSATPLFILH